MPVERKYPTVWEAVTGEPPLDPEEARRRRERAAGAWEQQFKENPLFEQVYGPGKNACRVEEEAGE